jgi:hypothetical protein
MTEAFNTFLLVFAAIFQRSIRQDQRSSFSD